MQAVVSGADHRPFDHHEDGSTERGSFAIFFAILALSFFAIVSLVVEGGRRLSAISLAQDLASEAARAAASTIDPATLALGMPGIEAGDALIEAEQLVALSPADAEVINVTVAPNGDRVTVVVEVRGEPFLPFFDMTVRGTHTAQVIDPGALP